MRFNILAAGYILFEAALAVPYDNFTGGVNLTRQVDSLEDYFTANYSSNDSAIYALSNGVPYAEHPYGSLLANPGGPLLLQDFNLMDSMSHFDRERIPERVVHAKGGGAHGYFELTDSLSDLTFARIFQEPGYTCPITVRFSTVGGERASPDTMRDARGFSIKLKTDIGNMDWVYLNTPVFFLRDPNKFPHFTHAQKRDPSTNLNQWTDSSRIWDYYLQNPEALHQITYMFGDRGCPKSWALMNGYSGHTFKFFNAAGNMTYVKFHLHSEQGVEGFSDEEAAKLHGQTDYNTQEFYNRIASGGKPAWTVYVQTMTPEQAENFTYSVNDLTKVWPHSQFPLRRAGRIILDQNPVNYFAEVEQAAFSPSHLIPGIEPSNDPVLQSRLYSYPDSHRYRLGVNYQQLPVNRPRTFESGSGCPFLAGNFQRDGYMAFDNQRDRPDFIRSSDKINAIGSDPRNYTNGIPPNAGPKYFGVVTNASAALWEHIQEERLKRAHEEKIWVNSFYTITGFSEKDVEQPKNLYLNVFNDTQKEGFITAIVNHASRISNSNIKSRVPSLMGLLDQQLGQKIADRLMVNYTYVTVDQYSSLIGQSSAY
ncbi:related to Catalase T [Zygosaccharomyces bailii]|nr:related to Catalase T [Zygosaccharomyces bailii]